MTDQNNQSDTGAQNAAPEATSQAPEIKTPESQTQEKSPIELAREAELADIAEMFKLDEKPAEDEKAKENSDLDPNKTPKPDAPAEEKKGEQTPAPAPSPAADGKPKDEAKPQSSDNLKELLADVLKDMKGEPKPEEKKVDAPPPPKYMPQIPDAIFAGLEHEDPAVRRQAMNAMIGGAMSKVYSDLTAEITAKVTEAVSKVPNMVEQSAQQKEQAAKTRKEFFDENPAFEAAGPKFHQFLAMAGIQFAQSLGAEYKGFTPEFRAKLAKHIEEMTGGAIKAGKSAAKPAATEIKPVKVANGFQAGGSASRAGDAGAKSLTDEIAETIGMTPN